MAAVNGRMKDAPVIRDTCGTRSGYQTHAYHGEKACEPCKTANKERFRKWYDLNKENEQNRWKKNYKNPYYREKKSSSNRSRRASQLAAESDNYIVADILHIYGINCYICDTSIDLKAPRRVGVQGWEKGLHLDHVISIKNGGQDTIENIRPTHALCNIKKSNRQDIEAK